MECGRYCYGPIGVDYVTVGYDAVNAVTAVALDDVIVNIAAILYVRAVVSAVAINAAASCAVAVGIVQLCYSFGAAFADAAVNASANNARNNFNSLSLESTIRTVFLLLSSKFCHF